MYGMGVEGRVCVWVVKMCWGLKVWVGIYVVWCGGEW